MCAVNLIPALYKKFIAKSNLLRDMFNLKKIYHKIMNYLTVKKPQLGRLLTYFLKFITGKSLYLGDLSYQTMGRLQKEYLHFFRLPP